MAASLAETCVFGKLGKWPPEHREASVERLCWGELQDVLKQQRVGEPDLDRAGCWEDAGVPLRSTACAVLVE